MTGNLLRSSGSVAAVSGAVTHEQLTSPPTLTVLALMQQVPDITAIIGAARALEMASARYRMASRLSNSIL